MIRPLVRFTYDLGRTWTRVALAGGYPHRIVLLDDDTLLVGDRRGSFQVYRRIPAGQGGA